jgi:hypothetical protein
MLDQKNIVQLQLGVNRSDEHRLDVFVSGALLSCIVVAASPGEQPLYTGG